MTDRILCVMPREMRMMSERILSLTAMPKGFVPSLCDIVMFSEAEGLGGFALLEADMPALAADDPARLSLDETGPLPVLDAGGLHAWAALPSALDLLGAGLDAIEVTNARHPGELRLAAALGPRRGLDVTVEGSRLSAAPRDVADPVLDRVMQQGCAIPADLWWRIWALAQTALTPDSEVSRRHAGPVIVTADGQLIGRTDNDDDTDPGFVRTPEPAEETRP